MSTKLIVRVFEITAEPACPLAASQVAFVCDAFRPVSLNCVAVVFALSRVSLFNTNLMTADTEFFVSVTYSTALKFVPTLVH